MWKLIFHDKSLLSLQRPISTIGLSQMRSLKGTNSFENFFTYAKEVGQNRLRESEGNFILPTNNKKLNITFPHIELVKSWNHTSYIDKSLTKISAFKNSIKSKMLNMYQNECSKEKCFSCGKK